MTRFVIDTESDGIYAREHVINIEADNWQLEGYDWFDFYRNQANGENVLVLRVRANVVRTIRKFDEEPTD